VFRPKPSPSRFTFHGTIDDIALDAQIAALDSNRFESRAVGRHASVQQLLIPEAFTLSIGDDGGTAAVTSRH